MRYLLSCFLLFTLILSLSISPALADKEVIIKRVDSEPPIPFIIGDGALQACQVGNTNPANWAIGGWAAAPEEYKLAFDPMVDGTCGTECILPGWGFEVNVIHIHIQVDVPCTLIVGVDVEEAVYPTSPDCPEPGALACASPLYYVALSSAGGWILNIPITCDCLAIYKEYLLGVYFDSAPCNVDLVTDNFPTACTSWNNWGAGWVDLVVDYGFPGNLKIWADAECCEPPVPAAQLSWGVIKKLYKE